MEYGIIKEFPSLAKQAFNLGKAAVEHTMAGFPRVSEDEFKRRINICNKCDSLIPNSMRCRECGCFMTKKAWWKEQECQLNKW